MRKFAKIQDFAAAMPLAVLYFIWIAGLVSRLSSEWPELLNSFTVARALNVVYEVATILFLYLVMTLLAFRRLPEHYAKGVLPRAAAIIGANLQLLSLALPRAQLSFPVLAASTVATIVGLAGSIYVAAFLGRSFSVFPQARGLVTAGPYRFVRHPLYVAEQIAVFGIMWQYAQPWASFIIVASLAAQFLRMHYEEKVLAEIYPAYRAYMARTGSIFPRVSVSGSKLRDNCLNGFSAMDAANSSLLVE